MKSFVDYLKKANHMLNETKELFELFWHQYVAIMKELLQNNSEALSLDHVKQYMKEIPNGSFTNQTEKDRKKKCFLRINKFFNATQNEESSCLIQSLFNNTNNANNTIRSTAIYMTNLSASSSQMLLTNNI